MMTMPANVTARWISTLDNDELLATEAKLYADFRTREVAEKSRAGARYMLLQGPSALVNAWHQWILASNETRARGVIVRHAR